MFINIPGRDLADVGVRSCLLLQLALACLSSSASHPGPQLSPPHSSRAVSPPSSSTVCPEHQPTYGKDFYKQFCRVLRPVDYFCHHSLYRLVGLIQIKRNVFQNTKNESKKVKEKNHMFFSLCHKLLKMLAHD